MAADHKSILGRSDNIVFVRFARIAEPRYAAFSEVHTCRSCLLYVGGQCAVLPHLRRHAQTRCLELLHHDGGEENSLHALEGLVGRADAVLCPIDCVSHQACLAAKRLCRRLDKPFVPLRTSSGTCFLRAIDHWRATAAPGAVAPATILG